MANVCSWRHDYRRTNVRSARGLWRRGVWARKSRGLGAAALARSLPSQRLRALAAGQGSAGVTRRSPAGVRAGPASLGGRRLGSRRPRAARAVAAFGLCSPVSRAAARRGERHLAAPRCGLQPAAPAGDSTAVPNAGQGSVAARALPLHSFFLSLTSASRWAPWVSMIILPSITIPVFGRAMGTVMLTWPTSCPGSVAK